MVGGEGSPERSQSPRGYIAKSPNGSPLGMAAMQNVQGNTGPGAGGRRNEVYEDQYGGAVNYGKSVYYGAENEDFGAGGDF